MLRPRGLDEMARARAREGHWPPPEAAQLHVMLVLLGGAARTDIKTGIRSLVGKKAAFDNYLIMINAAVRFCAKVFSQE